VLVYKLQVSEMYYIHKQTSYLTYPKLKNKNAMFTDGVLARFYILC